jgi:hypothetical protein
MFKARTWHWSSLKSTGIVIDINCLGGQELEANLRERSPSNPKVACDIENIYFFRLLFTVICIPPLYQFSSFFDLGNAVSKSVSNPKMDVMQPGRCQH